MKIREKSQGMTIKEGEGIQAGWLQSKEN